MARINARDILEIIGVVARMFMGRKKRAALEDALDRVNDLLGVHDYSKRLRDVVYTAEANKTTLTLTHEDIARLSGLFRTTDKLGDALEKLRDKI